MLPPPGPARTRWQLRGRRFIRVFGVLVAGGLFGGSTALLLQLGAPGYVAPFLAALQTLPFAVAWRAPLAAWRLMVLGLFISTLLGFGFGPPTSAVAFVPVVYCVAARYERRIVFAVGVLTTGLLILPWLWIAGLAGAGALVAIGVLIGVLMLGDAVRRQREVGYELAVSEERRQYVQAQQAVLEEKSRIARELHDVVAHHMSMVAIQAEAAPYKIDELSEEGRRTFAAIRDASREALSEMRRIIGLLREEAADADRVPQPGLDRLDELVDGARDAGTPVEVSMLGDARPLPAGVDLSAYRIVQEALSNAARHAHGAPVEVEVWYQRAALRVRVANGPAVAAPAAPLPELGRWSGSEHGLVGMRERVAMLGGELHAGPRVTGGYLVEAVLPFAGDGQVDDEPPGVP